MPSKRPIGNTLDDVVGILHSMSKHMDGRFDDVDAKFKRVDERFEEVVTRLDRIEFFVSGQERRISILEDRMREVATKLGLEFRQQA